MKSVTDLVQATAKLRLLLTGSCGKVLTSPRIVRSYIPYEPFSLDLSREDEFDVSDQPLMGEWLFTVRRQSMLPWPVTRINFGAKMVDLAIRRRVQRLLGGDLQADHFTKLFLYARDRCDGREAVQEIGDFLAHHDQRTKGILTRSTRDFFFIARFYAALTSYKGTQHFYTVLPAYTPDFLRANVRTLSPTILRRKIRLSRNRAQAWVEDLISRLHRNPDGTYCLKAYDDAEIDRFDMLCGTMEVQPIFTADRLFRDFTATLRSNGVLERHEEHDFLSLQTPVSLLAVAAMHRCEIVMEDGSCVRLTADLAWNKIGVSAAIPVDVYGKVLGEGGVIFFSRKMFTTELEEAHCDQYLLANKKWDDLPLQVVDGCQLAPL